MDGPRVKMSLIGHPVALFLIQGGILAHVAAGVSIDAADAARRSRRDCFFMSRIASGTLRLQVDLLGRGDVTRR